MVKIVRRQVNIILIAHKYSVGELLQREHLECSICQKAKPKGYEPSFEEVWPGHANRIAIAITKLLLPMIS